MSVDVLGLINAANVDAHTFVTTPVYTGSVSFTVSVARAAKLWVGFDPLVETSEDAANPYHAEVWGNPRPDRISKGQQKALLRICMWFVEIRGLLIVRPPPEKT